MKLILTFSLLLYGIISTAQSINVSLEDGLKYPVIADNTLRKGKEVFSAGTDKIEIENAGGFYSLPHSLTIRKLDASGKEIGINKLDGGAKSFGALPSQATEFDGRILLFYVSIKDEDCKLFVSEINKNSLELSNTVHLFSFQARKKGLIANIQSGDRLIMLYKSADSSKMMVLVQGEKESLFSCVFERGLKIKRQKISTLKETKGLDITDIIVDNAGNSAIVFSEKKYSMMQATYDEAKYVYFQKSDNSDRMIDVLSLGAGTAIYELRFELTKDQSKTFAFGNYAAPMFCDGIWTAELKLGDFKFTNARKLQYPDEFKKNINKLGFGDKHKGVYGVFAIRYSLFEFGDGDVVLSGNPVLYDYKTSTSGRQSSDWFAGPIVMAFINRKNEPVFSMIPRHQNFGNGSKAIMVPYNDKLVVIYNDYEKNIKGELQPDRVHQKGRFGLTELTLAYAIVKKDGTIESRKLLSEGISKKNYFNTGFRQFVTDRKLLIPTAISEKETEVPKVAVVTID